MAADSRPTRADLEEEIDRLNEALTDIRDQLDDVLEGGEEEESTEP